MGNTHSDYVNNANGPLADIIQTTLDDYLTERDYCALRLLNTQWKKLIDGLIIRRNIVIYCKMIKFHYCSGLMCKYLAKKGYVFSLRKLYNLTQNGVPLPLFGGNDQNVVKTHQFFDFMEQPRRHQRQSRQCNSTDDANRRLSVYIYAKRGSACQQREGGCFDRDDKLLLEYTAYKPQNEDSDFTPYVADYMRFSWSYLFLGAASSGNINMMKYAMNNSYDDISETFLIQALKSAFVHGHLHIVEYIRENMAVRSSFGERFGLHAAYTQLYHGAYASPPETLQYSLELVKKIMQISQLNAKMPVFMRLDDHTHHEQFDGIAGAVKHCRHDIAHKLLKNITVNMSYRLDNVLLNAVKYACKSGCYSTYCEFRDLFLKNRDQNIDQMENMYDYAVVGGNIEIVSEIIDDYHARNHAIAFNTALLQHRPKLLAIILKESDNLLNKIINNNCPFLLASQRQQVLDDLADNTATDYIYINETISMVTKSYVGTHMHLAFGGCVKVLRDYMASSYGNFNT